MKAHQFQVIADVYKLLVAHDAKALVAASRLPGISRNLRSALESLAMEAAGRSQALNSRSPSENDRSRTTRKSNAEFFHPDLPSDVYRERLVVFLMNPKRFPDKTALVEFANRIGLSLSPDARMSRKRVAGRIARQITDRDELRRSLHSALRQSSDQQTAGWLNLILNP